MYDYTCCWCNQNHADALHHILGRVSNSPLNAAPIGNLSCHIGNYALDGFDVQARLLQRTYKFLMSEGYLLTSEDKEFKNKYEKYYV